MTEYNHKYIDALGDERTDYYLLCMSLSAANKPRSIFENGIAGFEKKRINRDGDKKPINRIELDSLLIGC